MQIICKQLVTAINGTGYCEQLFIEIIDNVA